MLGKGGACACRCGGPQYRVSTPPTLCAGSIKMKQDRSPAEHVPRESCMPSKMTLYWAAYESGLRNRSATGGVAPCVSVVPSVHGLVPGETPKVSRAVILCGKL